SQFMQEQFSERNIRWVPFENYHMTQVFIGNIPHEEINDLEAVIREAIQGEEPFEIALGDPALFPPDNEKKGVLIATVNPSDALMVLQSKLDKAFRASGYALIERPYRPHVTLARLRRAKMEEEELPQFGAKMKSLVDHVHIYETHKQDGRVVNSILRSIVIEN
ncbi:MAG: RNA 2',3'-cyclic phosphodiesterase, partial [Emcibacteraceae bacterium]|nr:RNA 2',3'-cyclic phosphodiesterase [Emcibacteraceae bacterium]